ncbi:MAG: fatty acid desaturase, partial [Okeania sp. SIO2D1]|nr:fatty acid desaturase [Okeania sp. SIO2D1]
MTVSIAESTNGNSEIRNEQLQLKDIVKSLPREVFLKDKWKTWTMVAVNIFMVVLGYWGLTITPWFLLPLLW